MGEGGEERGEGPGEERGEEPWGRMGFPLAPLLGRDTSSAAAPKCGRPRNASTAEVAAQCGATRAEYKLFRQPVVHNRPRRRLYFRILRDVDRRVVGVDDDVV